MRISFHLAISRQIQEISSRYEMEKQYSQHESSEEITFHFEKQNIVPNSTTNHTFGVHESRSHELSNNEIGNVKVPDLFA